MSIPDRIDIIAAAVLQGMLSRSSFWPTEPTKSALICLALEMGQRYHDLRQPGPLPATDPPSPPPARTDANVIPIASLGDLKAIEVMGTIS